MKKNVLVIAAHIGDFIWRSGGTIARFAKEGHNVGLIVMSYAMRGECNEYWKQPGSNMEEGRRTRLEEAENAVKTLGISSFEVMDYDDYQIDMNRERIRTLAERIAAFKPDVILTHDSEKDAYNADHSTLGTSVPLACTFAMSPAMMDGKEPLQTRPVILGFEPHVADACNFSPDIYVDITEVIGLKDEAMAGYTLQKGMRVNYCNRASLRGLQSGLKDCRYAEAFSVREAPLEKTGLFQLI